MSEALPVLYQARHGETAWSLSGQHTGLTSPGGESPAQVGERADRVVQRIRTVAGDVLLFSSGHFIRVLAARRLGLGPGSAGKYFLLSTARVSALGYEHNLSQPVLRLWKDDHQVSA